MGVGVYMRCFIQHFQLTGSGLVGRLGEIVALHVTTVHGHEQGHVPTHHQLKVASPAQEIIQKRVSAICVSVQVDCS